MRGFALSHKREEKTRYVFEKGGRNWLMPTRLEDHKEILPKVKRKSVSKGDWDSDDYVSEERLRLLLKHINPGCDRLKWISTLGAIKDAKIGRRDHTYMEPFDKFELADDWSSGALGNFEPVNYQDCEDVIETMESLTRGSEPATIGSLVHTAKAGGMDELAHRRLHKAEPFTHPDNAPKGKGEGGKEPERKSRFRFTSRDALDEDKPPAWLIPNFLPEGAYALLAGAPGAFKTFIGLDISLSIATGCTTGSWSEIDQSGPVLFAAGEATVS